MPEFPSITHVALTVSDLERSRPLYESLIGRPPVIDEDTGLFHHVVWLLGGQTLVGIHQFPDPHGSDAFDERRPGLDHVAFACADRGALEQWETKLNDWASPTAALLTPPTARACVSRSRQHRTGVLRPAGVTRTGRSAQAAGASPSARSAGSRPSVSATVTVERRMPAPSERRPHPVAEVDTDTALVVRPKGQAIVGHRHANPDGRPPAVVLRDVGARHVGAWRLDLHEAERRDEKTVIGECHAIS